MSLFHLCGGEMGGGEGSRSSFLITPSQKEGVPPDLGVEDQNELVARDPLPPPQLPLWADGQKIWKHDIPSYYGQ